MEKNLNQLQPTSGSGVIKIALFGPESTGKTTLANQLSEHFNTVCVPEFARDYLQEKWDKTAQICDVDDMLPIAYGQTQLENELLSKANKFLFCDTNLMVTKVFSEVYYNYCDPLLDKAAKNHEYDLVFLTDIDVPWEKDDLRDKPQGREAIFEVFKQTLIDTNKPFITLSGSKELRLKNAIQISTDLENAKKIGLSSHDFVQIFEHGISLESIQNQIEIFKNGISKAILFEPAMVSKGILKLSENDFQSKSDFFDANKSNFKLEKFVPASGAASRMFKFLAEFLNDFDIENETINGYINRKKDKELHIFIVGMNKFPFFQEVYLKLKATIPNFDQLERDYKNYYFIQFLMSSDYFDFANRPKGVLPFHRYEAHVATAIEEHLYECANYSSSNSTSNLHFTVSENHLILFENSVSTIKQKVEKETSTTINVSYSFQKKSTDTIAVDAENKPFRDENGKLFFRPGGHGALIENLSHLEADVIFIKNIDNVIQNNAEKITLYKKALAGILIELQQQIFQYLNQIDDASEEFLDEIQAFAENNLNIELQENFSKYTFENKMSYLKNILDRPIRICGMVKNEGEPGGGPFWVRDRKGNLSLQIVESSQVDLQNASQVKILNSATYFNPVDLVCGIRNYKNEKFDLTQFIDHTSGFIVEKTIKGKPIKSYELPGLWNGAMANWITIFVDVPLLTFNPVKTVNDLLKPSHQPR
jgi:nicotinamide riboside kinase